MIYQNISSPWALSQMLANISHYDIDITIDIIMSLWYLHDISIYQAPQHLHTSRKIFEIMIIIAIF